MDNILVIFNITLVAINILNLKTISDMEKLMVKQAEILSEMGELISKQSKTLSKYEN